MAELRDLVGNSHPVVEIPLLPDEPTDLKSLAALGEEFNERLDEEIRNSEFGIRNYGAGNDQET